MFQSSPARGGGCNVLDVGDVAFPDGVSILTRPWGRVQRVTLGDQRRAAHVSILTRPWGRVQLKMVSIICVMFCFNPHPPVGAGATERRGVGASRPSAVSILTRPWGRVQHMPRRANRTRYGFQSSPARGSGCNSACSRASTASDSSFQSSPARGGGCNTKSHGTRTSRSAFQSSPARGGGCNGADSACDSGVGVCFNPHPPVGAGATFSVILSSSPML